MPPSKESAASKVSVPASSPAPPPADGAPPAAPAVPAEDDAAEDGLLLVGGKPGMYHCNSCMRDISQVVRIKCAECKDWDSCVDCFCAGAELAGHKAYHPYRVVDNTSYPIFAPEWTATEELNMLSAMEQHGLGNFGKVSELLGVKDKTEKACMEHYIDLYTHSYGSILPESTILRNGSTVPTSTLLDPQSEKGEEYYKMKPLSVEAYPAAEYLRDAPPLPPDGTRCPREKFRSGKPNDKDKQQGDSVVAVLGYMPLRNDFDVEHDQDAELVLADMEIDPINDHPAEKALKLAVVDVYNRKLDEREKRKEFVKKYNLIDYKTLQSKEKRKSKDERELLAKMRIFTRFFETTEEYEQFVQGVVEAKKLRKRIEQLQQYRRLGIRNQQEATAYETEKRKREQEQQMKRQSATYLLDTGKGGSNSFAARDRMQRYKKRHRSGGDDDDDDDDKGAGRRDGPAALDIDDTPGVDLLSTKEKELCGVLRLLPKPYLKIKARLLQECKKRGYLDKDAARQMVSVDVNKMGHVYDFLVECKWVNPSARPELKLSDISSKVINEPPPSSSSQQASTGGRGGAAMGAEGSSSNGKQQPQPANHNNTSSSSQGGEEEENGGGGEGGVMIQLPTARADNDEEEEEEDIATIDLPMGGVLRATSVDRDTPDDEDEEEEGGQDQQGEEEGEGDGDDDDDDDNNEGEAMQVDE